MVCSDFVTNIATIYPHVPISWLRGLGLGMSRRRMGSHPGLVGQDTIRLICCLLNEQICHTQLI